MADIGSIIGGSAAAASSAYNMADSLLGGSSHKSRKMLRYQHEMNKRQIEEITKPYYEWQLKESPRLQVAGLLKAGINPLTQFGTNTSPMGGDSMSSLAPADASSALGAQASLKQTDIASSLGMAQVLQTLADTKKTKAETIGQEQENKRLVTFNKFAETLYRSEAQSAEGLVSLQKLDAKLKVADEKRIYAAVNNLEADTKNKAQQFKNMCQELKNLITDNSLKQSQVEQIEQDIALTIARTAREKYGLNLDKQQLGLLRAQTSLAIKQGNILYPQECLVDFLQSDPNRARDYGKAQYNVTFSEGADAEIHSTIRLGGVPRVYEKRVRGVVDKFKQGEIVDGIIEAASISQDAINWITDSAGAVIGSLFK